LLTIPQKIYLVFYSHVFKKKNLITSIMYKKNISYGAVIEKKIDSR